MRTCDLDNSFSFDRAVTIIGYGNAISHCCANILPACLYTSISLELWILHTRLTTLCPGLPGWAGTRKVKPIWILLKQQTVSGSGISWTICKSASRSRQRTTPAPHHSVFYRPDALPATQPTASKYWRHETMNIMVISRRWCNHHQIDVLLAHNGEE